LKDIPQIAQLGLAILKFHQKIDPYFKAAPDALKSYQKYFRSCIYSRKSLLLVAEFEGQIIGYSLSQLVNRPPVFAIQKIGLISDVFIMEKFRRQGLSKKLLQENYRWFKKHQRHHVHLIYHQKNPLASQAWPKQGYQQFMSYNRLKI
ncbi:GNAT family N-acetyltransferase, partial [Candidatus Peregrinibacteria bacterium]|nr:GNAT family N-acetyltransferase [Candidatus Peregrinibacteria bacterium]